MPILPPVDLPKVDHAQIAIDGVADEAAWADAVELTDFVAYRPKPGVPASENTIVRFISTDSALYLHFEARDASADRIQAGFGRRDSRRNDDYVGIALDLLGTGERANLFIVNPLGVQLDGTLVRGRDRNPVPWRGGWSSWDAQWASAGRIHESGYDVELEIPWAAVRHPERIDSFRFMVFRRVARTVEMSSWPTLDPNVQGTLVQTATMTGPGRTETAHQLRIQPEFTALQTQDGPPDDRIGFRGLSAGGTVRYDPSPNLQVLATVNPDFSNVESDEAKIDVNSRYSLQYEEKRPFFLEGQEWFSHPMRDLVYTRSMVAPLTGARVTSESSGWAVAALNVLDQSPAPSVTEREGWSSDDVDGRQAVATVGRLRRSFGKDNMFGAIVSDKRLLGTTNRHHLVGVDGRISLTERTTIEASALASSTQGTDQDGTWTPAATVSNRIRTRNWQNDIDFEHLSPDFRTENGFQPRADWTSISNESEFHIFPQKGFIPRVFFNPIDVEAAWDSVGDPRLTEWAPNGGFWTRSGLMFMGTTAWTSEEFADQWFTTRSVRFMGGGSLSQRLRLWIRGKAGEALLYDEANPVVGRRNSVFVDVGFQPARFLRIAPQVGWERFDDDGTEVYSGTISRVKLEAFATPTVWGRYIADVSTFSGRVSHEGLLAWEQSPGRAVYVGGHTAITNGTDEDPIADPEREWTAFTKVSWVFNG